MTEAEIKKAEAPAAAKAAEAPALAEKPEVPKAEKPQEAESKKSAAPKVASEKPAPKTEKPKEAPKKPVAPKAGEILIFNRWSCDVEVKEEGLKRYLSVKPVIVPKTGARYAGNRFHKSKINVVERLINRLMIPGHKAKKHKLTSGNCTGKANTAYDIVYETFEIIEKRVKQNPVEVLIRAIENAAPREEIITIEYGGARYPKPVECAPQRRIDTVLRLMTQGAFQKQFGSKKSSCSALADEIILAYQASNNSVAISKKLETERQADSSR